MSGLGTATGRRELQASYARQRAALDASHARDGVNVFVSPFDILRDAAGTELSYSTWPEGVPTWLPRTECIALAGKRAEARWGLVVRWEDVEAICPGALAPVVGPTPVRMRTVAWPDAARLAALTAVAIIKM